MQINGNVDIILDLSNGVYVFVNESSTGKTRLAKLLHEYRVAGKPVASYTYSDVVLGRDIAEVFNERYKVIYLDRYDLYNGMGSDLIQRRQDDAIILIDCKQGTKIRCPKKICHIDMTLEQIRVYLT